MATFQGRKIAREAYKQYSLRWSRLYSKLKNYEQYLYLANAASFFEPQDMYMMLRLLTDKAGRLGIIIDANDEGDTGSCSMLGNTGNNS